MICNFYPLELLHFLSLFLSTYKLVCRCGSYIRVSCNEEYRAVHLRLGITVSSTCITTDRGTLAT